MSNPSDTLKTETHQHGHEDEDLEHEPSLGNSTLTLIGALGFILIFLLILALTYIPTRPRDVTELRSDQRRQTLQEVSTAQAGAYTEYGVVNAEDGLFKIPVSDAMQLVVKEEQQAQRTSGGSE